MRWVGRRQSTNVEDRRGMGRGGVGLGVGGGIGAVILVLVLMFLGGDPGMILDQNQNLPIPGGPASTLAPANDQMKQFVSVVLADSEDFWTRQFAQMGEVYDPPTLVLFSGVTQTGSGVATSATGPFYSPVDQKLYIDLSFFEELSARFQAPGDFAQAYVIAHEVGHHVQNQLGILEQVTAAQQRVSEAQANDLSVRLELQADFLAGMWAHYAQTMIGVLEPGDIEEALTAASAIGDDRIQMQAQGYVVPDSFTHGTSAQRSRWFNLGYQTGDISQGNTFSANPL